MPQVKCLGQACLAHFPSCFQHQPCWGLFTRTQRSWEVRLAEWPTVFMKPFARASKPLREGHIRLCWKFGGEQEPEWQAKHS